MRTQDATGEIRGATSGPLAGGDRSFSGIRTFLRLPHPAELDVLSDADFAVIGLPFDTGVSYRPGARFGPSALRDISALLRPYNPALEVSLTEHLRGVDLGDAPVVAGNTSQSIAQMTDAISRVTARGVIPVGLGGDHTVSLPMLRAVAEHHGPVALLHFDSHPDTWDTLYGEKYNHGTPFRRAIEEGLILPGQSVQLGIRGTMLDAAVLRYSREVGFSVIPATALLGMSPDQLAERISGVLRNAPVFMSFDVDFLDPAYAPGTGTPEIGGPSTAQALGFLRALDLSNLVGLDCVEVLPAHDNAQITALAGATVVYEALCLHARSRLAAGEQ